MTNDLVGVVTKRVLITGRVQGVHYRDSCREQAKQLGVSGWVTNCPDGAVMAVLHGEAPDVDRMIDWCHNGPPRAIVKTVYVANEPDDEQFEGFSIRP